jgi:hypothetical protein
MENDSYKNIINLFTNYFDEIKLSNKIIEDYNWANINEIFSNLYDSIINITNTSTNTCEFIKNYYLFTLMYVYYTSFLSYINHKDYNNCSMYDFFSKIKYDSQIVMYIYNNKLDDKISTILKTFNTFLTYKLRQKTSKKIQEQEIVEYIKNIRSLDKLYLLDNTHKKLLGIIMHRFILSNNFKYKNFNDFFIENIINNKKYGNLDFNTFINQIPNSKQILSLQINSEINNNLNINLNKLIEHTIKNHNVRVVKEGNNLIITHNKHGGKVIICKSKTNTNEINIYQQNTNLINFNIKEIRDMSFLKRTNNFIVISYSSKNITDLSTCLHLTHLLTMSLKILESFASSIYEYMYPIEYNSYYYDSFVNFLSFIKKSINTDKTINKYLLDLFKYYFIYSYYDYYFYVNNLLINGILENIQYKNDMFLEFCSNLKKQFKLPNDMLNYPPFFNVNDDIDNPLYYTFEIPNYFK